MMYANKYHLESDVSWQLQRTGHSGALPSMWLPGDDVELTEPNNNSWQLTTVVE